MPLDVRNKLVVVPGDMHAPGLGLSEADWQRLQAEVNYVIHSAASISFFEHVHTLLEQNYEVGLTWMLLLLLHACMHCSGGMQHWARE